MTIAQECIRLQLGPRLFRRDEKGTKRKDQPPAFETHPSPILQRNFEGQKEKVGKGGETGRLPHAIGQLFI